MYGLLLLATIIIRNGDFKLLRVSSIIETFLGGKEIQAWTQFLRGHLDLILGIIKKNPTTLQLQGWLSKAFNKDFQRINIKQKPAAVDTFNISSFDIFIWNLNCLCFVKKCFYILRTPFFCKPLELHFHDKWMMLQLLSVLHSLPTLNTFVLVILYCNKGLY